jgi:hemerythrin
MYSKVLNDIKDEHNYLESFISVIYNKTGVKLFSCAFQFHASDEERAMRKSSYPKYQEHKSEHERITDLLDGLDVEDPEVTKSAIRDVVSTHITEFDEDLWGWLQPMVGVNSEES